MLSAQRIQQLYADRLTSGLSSTTVNHLHGTMHKALSDAERLGLVARNVSDLVNVPRIAGSEMHPLSPADTRTLLGQVRGDRLEAAYIVAVATGMRQSELVGQCWADVDLDAVPTGQIRVRVQLARKHDTWTWKERKT